MRKKILTVRETADFYKVAVGTAKSLPGIRFGGAWLREAGFEAGKRVSLTVQDGQIVIKVEEEHND
jgi:hypothetical protein